MGLRVAAGFTLDEWVTGLRQRRWPTARCCKWYVCECIVGAERILEFSENPMLSFRTPCISLVAFMFAATIAHAQQLSNHWEDLTSEDFVKALHQSQSTCLLPYGIIEKHGPSGPLGTDLMNGRYIANLATQQEYSIVFPPYYIGQISEARSQPGTLAYPAHLQLEMLQATVDEMARNGCKKIIIQNAHGGNTMLLHYFAQTQLDKRHDYVVYAYFAETSTDLPAAAKPSKPGVDGHAGEGEIANVMAHTPEDAHPERAGEESGADQHHLNLPSSVYTGIWWYASYPNHYQGDASQATAVRGKAATEYAATRLAQAIRSIKVDRDALRLQTEFFDKADHPVETKQ
jgi:creatinine amidohydrolase